MMIRLERKAKIMLPKRLILCKEKETPTKRGRTWNVIIATRRSKFLLTVQRQRTSLTSKTMQTLRFWKDQRRISRLKQAR